jgi:hypothetical protein
MQYAPSNSVSRKLLVLCDIHKSLPLWFNIHHSYTFITVILHYMYLLYIRTLKCGLSFEKNNYFWY